MAAYFDNNATTAIDPRVLAEMLPFLQQHTGNPMSVHRYGRFTRTALERAREQVAQIINAHPKQVIFTGSATEANNLAIKGFAAKQAPGRLAVSSIEHKSVIAPALSLRDQGWQIAEIPVNNQGLITEELLTNVLQADIAFVSIMLANNETGVIQPISSLATLVKQKHALLHCDAVAALGKIRIDWAKLAVDMLSVSAHKLGGPQGVGALIINEQCDLAPIIEGGGHENNLRSGSYNVAGIVGFGKACELAHAELTERHFKMLSLQHHLEEGLANLAGITVISQSTKRLPNTTLLALDNIEGEMMIMQLDKKGFAVSSGSACGQGEPSHVVSAMQLPEELLQNVVRISVSQLNTEAEIDALLAAIAEIQNGYLR